MVSLDLYIAYLRAAFNTCYYCSVVTDHLEELQRKCIKHVRKPLSKAMLDELKVAEAEKEKKDKDEEMEDVEGVEQEREKEKKEGTGKERHGDNRDWKRNGLFLIVEGFENELIKYLDLDERWLEWLDSKLALLLNRDGVDPRAYSGKSYDE